MANFAPKGFDSEKAVVIEERRLRTEDNPEDALAEATDAAAFVAHPYHWPVIGWMHDVQGLTLDDALNFHNIFYSPQNAIIVAVGDFNADAVMKQITENFTGIKNGAKPPPMTVVEPQQDGERVVKLRHAADLPAYIECYHAPNYQSPDGFPLELTAMILAGGKSSRLYKKLVVEKQMVVDADASYDRASFDPNVFCLSAQVREGFKTEDVMKVADDEVTRLQEHPVDDQELQKAKNQVQAEFVFGQDSIFREAMLLGQFEMLGSYKSVDEIIDGTNKVTPADVQRVAKQYFGANNRTVATLVPENEEKGKP